MIKKCIICGKMFIVFDRPRKHAHNHKGAFRPHNCITCSKKCSSVHTHKR